MLNDNYRLNAFNKTVDILLIFIYISYNAMLNLIHAVCNLQLYTECHLFDILYLISFVTTAKGFYLDLYGKYQVC